MESEREIFGVSGPVNLSGHNPPRYVIAFRGTINKPGSRSQDLKLDLHFICNCLHQCSRFHHGLEIAINIVLKEAGNGNNNNVWLAGHSLGSAIALLVGRDMVKMGFHLETYLFNPPFASPPIQQIKNEKLKDGIRIANSFLTAGIAVAVGHHISRNNYYQESDPFTVLSKWVPYLFVNPSDPICCEYIGYFEHRDKMVRIGGGKIGKLATQNSVLSLISGGQGSEPIHLIPSGYMTINLSPCQDFKQAHGIDQWWRTDIYCEFKLHQFK
ncbi:hydrolase [Lithospermum erythrorhizon]|uniref:Hydrolase n=1 Tax=Lithospermum erythrorhizon TaxID=34254 RepID=A0AAV3R799_LITER